MTAHFPNRHAHAVSAIRKALARKMHPEAWIALVSELEANLNAYERAALLAAVAGSAEAADLWRVTDEIVSGGTLGAPLPALDEITNDARWWAGNASLPEIRIYLGACFDRLPAGQKRAFAEAVTRKVAA